MEKDNETPPRNAEERIICNAESRTESGYRMFSEDSLEALRWIRQRKGWVLRWKRLRAFLRCAMDTVRCQAASLPEVRDRRVRPRGGSGGGRVATGCPHEREAGAMGKDARNPSLVRQKVKHRRSVKLWKPPSRRFLLYSEGMRHGTIGTFLVNVKIMGNLLHGWRGIWHVQRFARWA
jgi:hypothetical protein